MKVEAVERSSHIQWRNMTWCCDQMGKAWLTGCVSFGDTNFSTINQNSQIYLMSAPGELGTQGTAIDYCPFCGQKIDVNVVRGNDAS